MPPTSFQDYQETAASRLLAYGQSLFDLRRYKDAESTLRQALARDPQSWVGHYFLGAALLAQSDGRPEKAREGLSEARRTIALRPDNETGYFLLSWAHLCLNKPKDALDAAHQGMRIDPQEAWGYSLVGRAYRLERDWDKELQAVETGLKIEPDHTTLLNLRAEALIMLGRKEEAPAAVEAALRSDPASPMAHANSGWLALYQGDEKEALARFREAMRLDPTSEAARMGLVQALHARSPFYRLLLGYFLWTRRATTGEFWAVIALLSGINTTLRVMTRAFPPLLILTLPYFALYQIFTFFTWTGDALINVAALAAALALRPGAWGLAWAFGLGALLSLGMLIPVAGIFKVDPSYRKRRGALVALAALLGASAACGWGGSFSLAPWHGVAVAVFLAGWVIYPWAANLIISMEG
jgi:tetratricopeptide (TPR) repeat protein